MAEPEAPGQATKANTVNIIVNTRTKTVEKDELSFAEIVALAPEVGGGAEVVYTVTYRRGHANKEGMLSEGDSVKVKEGMIFDVTATVRS